MPTSSSQQSGPFLQWLEIQRRLQVEAFDRDPALLEGDERADFIIWNVVALEDELHEMLQEVKWKPWLTTERGDIAYVQFLREAVDALHFLGNLLLCARPGYGDLETLAEVLWAEYETKVDENLRRQRDGYDGLKDKCPICKRELVSVTVGSSTNPNEGLSSIQCPVHGKVV